MTATGKPLSDLAMAERDTQVVALKRQDLSFQQIADHLGISKAGAIRSFQRTKRRIDNATDADYAAYRDEQLAAIAAMREVCDEIIAARHVSISNGHVVSEIKGIDDDGNLIYGDPYEDDAPVLAAIDRRIKLDDQEAKLLGLYAKVEVSHSGGVTYEIVGVDMSKLT
jgi:hypothetical protein